jgi:hypothetical protein
VSLHTAGAAGQPGKTGNFLQRKGIMQDKQICISEIEGRTIKHVFTDFDEHLLMIFTDDTFALAYAYNCDDEATIENGDLHIAEWWRYREILCDCGIVTQSQIDKWQAELDHRARQLVEERRFQYQRLKAEFENGPT